MFGCTLTCPSLASDIGNVERGVLDAGGGQGAGIGHLARRLRRGRVLRSGERDGAGVGGDRCPERLRSVDE
jgi:hypothetical protein